MMAATKFKNHNKLMIARFPEYCIGKDQEANKVLVPSPVQLYLAHHTLDIPIILSSVTPMQFMPRI